jgi:uncharacterized protein (TIGR04255 family)
MPTTVFKQPPLIEIVAEVRWNLPHGEVPPQFANVPMPVPDIGGHESHFLNFASKAGVRGYGQVERLVPPGFPLLAYQAAVRYRSSAANAPIFQLGPGVFTANIAPPYKSWNSFLPHLEIGIELLLESRADLERGQPFSEVRLTYFDAFGERLIRGKSVTDFLAQDLGIRIELPKAITEFCTNPAGVKPSISVVVPIKAGAMELKISEGWVRNAPTLIMVTTVIYKGPVQADRKTVLKALDEAHTIIHESFIAMTPTLHKLMEPETLE